MPAEVQFKEVT